MYVKCCIPNCVSTRRDVKLHKFPSYECQRKNWLEVINCEQLKQLEPSKLDKLLVCHKHFEQRFHTKTSGIRKTAYPSLFSAEEIETGVPKYDHKENVPIDHTYAKKMHIDHSYCKGAKQDILQIETLKDLQLCVVESTSPEDAQVSERNDRQVYLTNTNQPENAAADFIEETSSSSTYQPNSGKISPALKMPIKRRQKIVHKASNLSPQCKQLYDLYKKSKRMLKYSLRAKKALAFSRKTLAFSKKHKFEELTKEMNPLAKKLLWMQVKMCTKSKKGRRFTLEEKLIALSIFKQSPGTYKFLKNFFILPSQTTLKKMISRLDVTA